MHTKRDLNLVRAEKDVYKTDEYRLWQNIDLKIIAKIILSPCYPNITFH